MNKRWLWILFGLIGFFSVLFAGAAAGAGATYLALRAKPVQAASELILQTINLDSSNDEAGIVVTYVEAGSPAANAGIKRGDIILKVGDQQVNTMLELMQEIEGQPAGAKIKLTVLHCETTKEVRLTLAERNGHVYLGLTLSRTPILDVIPREFGSIVSPLEDPAFIITQVTPGSPAEESGIQVGMMITGIDDEALQADDDLAKIVGAHHPGDEIKFDIYRPRLNQNEQITVTLGEKPNNPGMPYLGVSYMPVPGVDSEGLRRWRFPQFGSPGLPNEMLPSPGTMPESMPLWHIFPELPEGVENAVVISSVVEGSPAAKAGLKEGDLITAVDGETVTDPETFVEIISDHDQGDEITLTIYRNGETEAVEIDVTLGEHPDKEGQAYLGVTIGGFLHIEGNPTFNEENPPFHFEFNFPWPDENFPGQQGYLIPGDEA